MHAHGDGLYSIVLHSLTSGADRGRGAFGPGSDQTTPPRQVPDCGRRGRGGADLGAGGALPGGPLSLPGARGGVRVRRGGRLQPADPPQGARPPPLCHRTAQRPPLCAPHLRRPVRFAP
eukprot:522536-Pyramimonas_sp.AAC.1